MASRTRQRCDCWAEHRLDAVHAVGAEHSAAGADVASLATCESDTLEPLPRKDLVRRGVRDYQSLLMHVAAVRLLQQNPRLVAATPYPSNDFQAPYSSQERCPARGLAQLVAALIGRYCACATPAFV